MQWYYLSDTHERIALSEAQFPALAAKGLLRPTTPVWRKGMPGWTACGEVKPEIFAAGVARDSDQRSTYIDNAAVQGTIVGIARVLAGYGPWIRIFAAFTLTTSLFLASFVGWQLWMAIKYGQEELYRGYGAYDLLKGLGWFDWILIAFQAAVSAFVAWAGIVLFRAPGRAIRARESGSEQALIMALQDMGRYFILTVSVLLLNAVFWIGLFLWLGWDKAFPAPGNKTPPANKVSV
jgi:hypothetical protein